MTTIKLTLTKQGIRDFKREMEAYRKALLKKCDLMCSKLADMGLNAAQGSVRMSNIDVAASIEIAKEGELAYIVFTDDENAAFAEFGTGVAGEGTYPGPLPPVWGYDLRWTPEAHDPKQPEKWYYYDDEDRRRWTWGQSADGFMFVGSETMRDMVMPIAKDVFSR